MPHSVRFRCLLSLAICGLITVGLPLPAVAQSQEFNYDEAKVPDFKLPDVLVAEDGTKITSAEQWNTKRRPEVLELFRRYVYGRTPAKTAAVRCELVSSEPALDGLAIRREYTVHLSVPGSAAKPAAGEQASSAKEVPVHLLLYLPAEKQQAVPAFLGLNFGGNHSIQADPGITLSTAWMRNRADRGYLDHKATEKSRGTARSRMTSGF